jgi:hypothetical protein
MQCLRLLLVRHQQLTSSAGTVLGWLWWRWFDAG